jgi:hypothetical protein
MLNFCSFSKKCFSGLRAIISALEQFLLFWCFSSFSITNHHFSPSIPSHSLGSLGESPLTALAAKIRHLKEACPFFFSCTDLHRMSPSSATGIQPRQVQHGEGHHLRCVWRTKGGARCGNTLWDFLHGFYVDRHVIFASIVSENIWGPKDLGVFQWLTRATMSVARDWEGDSLIRSRGRHNNQLTVWPCKKSVGIPSMRACSMNSRMLELTASWWVAMVDKPCAIPIGMMRTEARLYSTSLVLNFSQYHMKSPQFLSNL